MELIKSAGKWMQLEIMLNKINQTKKEKWHIFSDRDSRFSFSHMKVYFNPYN